jgi:hypothetical protein
MAHPYYGTTPYDQAMTIFDKIDELSLVKGDDELEAIAVEIDHIQSNTHLLKLLRSCQKHARVSTTVV